MAGKHYLPLKLNSYLRRLDLEYERVGFALLHEIIGSARIAVEEETSYDNWNGGTYGHDVILFLPPETMAKVAFRKQKEFCDQIAHDLNVCAEAVDSESFRTVVMQLFDESDPQFQRATSLIDQPGTNPDTLSIWRPGYIRLFISHRDTKKAEAKKLERDEIWRNREIPFCGVM